MRKRQRKKNLKRILNHFGLKRLQGAFAEVYGETLKKFSNTRFFNSIPEAPEFKPIQYSDETWRKE